MRRFAILVALSFVVLGCSEEGRNPFLVRVAQINEGNAIQADVFNNVTNTIPEDIIKIIFTNFLFGQDTESLTDPTSFVYDFQVKTYSVTWRRVDGGPTSGAGWTLSDFNFTGAVTALVPANGAAEVGIILVPAGMLTQAPFVNALAGEDFQMVADIMFIGSPASDLSGEVQVPASVSVSIADFANQ